MRRTWDTGLACQAAPVNVALARPISPIGQDERVAVLRVRDDVHRHVVDVGEALLCQHLGPLAGRVKPATLRWIVVVIGVVVSVIYFVRG